MKKSIYYLLFVYVFTLFVSCSNSNGSSVNPQDLVGEKLKSPDSKKIQVLNFATFHFGFTPDAHSVEFDEHNENNQKQAHEIAAKLAAFKPTVILVERTPENNTKLLEKYSEYCLHTDMEFERITEIELIAYEVGRISGVKRIFGIDHQMRYNYAIDQQIHNSVDSITTNSFEEDPTLSFPIVKKESKSPFLLENLKVSNTEEYLDFLITVNADILTHAATDGNFEGADEAAKFYQRNLRMYTNLNRVSLKPDDRVFILMGGAHTAFFRQFMSRSPKYEMVNTFDYLK